MFEIGLWYDYNRFVSIILAVFSNINKI